MREIIYGIHTVQVLLKSSPERFQKVFVMRKRKNKRLLSLVHDLKLHGVETQLINYQFFNQKIRQKGHQGIIAYIKSDDKKYRESDLLSLITKFDNFLLLILDGVTDPRNLGACLRSADAAGVLLVIIPKDRSAQLNMVARKVACGAAENVPIIRVTNLARTLRMLQEENVWIIGTTEKADCILYKSKMTDSKLALVMGSEGSGIRHLTYKYCNELISIPMMGNVSSLNISVATGICLFEVIRRRIFADR